MRAPALGLAAASAAAAAPLIAAILLMRNRAGAVLHALALRLRRLTVQPRPPLVHIAEQGDLEGQVVDGVAHFLAVPYAAPPVGTDRWRPPQPPEPWRGVRRNPRELPRCPQPIVSDFNDPAKTLPGHKMVDTEDCLVLNVFAPPPPSSSDSGPLRPVVFYIHGGAGKLGSCHSSDLGGEMLAGRGDVVYIAPNYRLGAFGFLAHPELSQQDEAHAGAEAISGNAGVSDLLAALRWVQRHARAFGGDPGNVTLWGLSSGAQFVCTLLVSPPAASLFHRAMVQSCVDLSNVRHLCRRTRRWRHMSAEECGVALGEALGCAAGAAQLERMRGVSADTIVKHSWTAAAADCYEPAVDPRASCRPVKPEHSLHALQAGAFHRVPLLLGVTSADGLGRMELEWLLFDEGERDVHSLDALLRQEFGERASEARALYLENRQPERPGEGEPTAAAVAAALDDISADLWYAAATWTMSDLVAAAQAPPVYLYEVHEPGFVDHGADTPLWNGRAAHSSCNGSQASPASRAAFEYLVRFARTGDPNGGASPRWTPHRPGADTFMCIGPDVRMDTRPAQAVERHRLVREYLERSAAL